MRRKKAITLIEMLTVLAIVALLAGILIPSISAVTNYLREAGQKATFAMLEGALEEYSDFTGYYPKQPEKDFTKAAAHSEFLYAKLNAIPGSREILEKISAKLIQNKTGTGTPEIYDLWGMVIDYRYNPEPDGDSFPKLISAGLDGLYGTGDDICNF